MLYSASSLSFRILYVGSVTFNKEALCPAHSHIPVINAVIGCLLVFAILTVEELKPMWGASTCSDPLDILAGALGALVAIAACEDSLPEKFR